MRATRLLILVVAMVALGVTMLPAQPGPGQGNPRYNKATETTIVGVVDEVQSHQGRGGGSGTHLAVKTETGVVDVHVGPTNWLATKHFTFAKGDRLEVLGSKIQVDGADAFIAREIKKGETTMVLRNDAGIPAWSGGRQGR